MSFFEKQPALSNCFSVNFKDILKQLKEICFICKFHLSHFPDS